MAQHHPTGSETSPSYASRSSRCGSEPPSVEDDVNVWRYAIVSCMPETTTTTTSFYQLYFFISVYRKSMRGDNFTHTPAPRHFSSSHQFQHVGSGDGHNRLFQLLSKLVQGLCPPRGGRNLPHSIDFMYRPYAV